MYTNSKYVSFVQPCHNFCVITHGPLSKYCSFQNLFERVQAGCFKEVTVTADLKNALLQLFVGAKTDALMVTSNSQSVMWRIIYTCKDPTEKLHYSYDYEMICRHWASADVSDDFERFPLSEQCEEQGFSHTRHP